MSGGGLDAVTQQRLRDLLPRVLGAVARRCGDFATAEDAVQDALLAAVAEWRASGVPDNPGGWLFQVALRRLQDHAARESARRRRETAVAAATPVSAPPPEGPDDAFTAEDDTLTLLFLCCHPALSPPSSIALTLRAVGGLTTAEIASAFLVPVATMAQRISRAKASIEAAGATFALPDAAERDRRMSAVLHVLYLMFTEGHTSSAGPQLVRIELADEAIRLARLLHRLQPEHAEAAGLLALLLLTDARRPARTGADGELIALPEQDRARWNRAAIDEGTALVTATLAKGRIGSYQVQAAIAALHGEAASTAATDWPQILALYNLLQRMSDNPMVALNRAVAAAMVHGPAAGLELVEAIELDGRLAAHHRLAAVRAHLCELAGDLAAARRHYLLAAERTASLPERHYLTAKAARLAPNTVAPRPAP